MDPVSAQRTSDEGVPRATRKRAGGARVEEQWAGANEAKTEKLRLRSVQRQAGARGFQLRHSDYGYGLVDTERKSVNGRNDMTLKEVESLLGRA